MTTMELRTNVDRFRVLYDRLQAVLQATNAISVREGVEHLLGLLPNGTLRVYEQLPRGMCTTHADVINADLIAFIED